MKALDRDALCFSLASMLETTSLIRAELPDHALEVHRDTLALALRQAEQEMLRRGLPLVREARSS